MESGILLLDKPAGLSSNAALQRVRRTLGAHKAGHVGSLDPLATGMLPICLGEATKIAGEILAGRKCYRFTIGLGLRTATGDVAGAVVETAPVPALNESAIDAVLQGFLGPQTQIPPMYSALKRAGQPLYKLARAGLEVEREARPIELFALRLLAFSAAARLELQALCSKGTYVRTLAQDIGARLAENSPARSATWAPERYLARARGRDAPAARASSRRTGHRAALPGKALRRGGQVSRDWRIGRPGKRAAAQIIRFLMRRCAPAARRRRAARARRVSGLW